MYPSLSLKKEKMLSFLYGLSYDISVTECIPCLLSIKLSTSYQNDENRFCLHLMLIILCDP